MLWVPVDAVKWNRPTPYWQRVAPHLTMLLANQYSLWTKIWKTPRGCCNKGYPSQRTLNSNLVKSCLPASYLQIVLQFCTSPGHVITMSCATFYKDSTTDMDAMGGRDFARFEFNSYIPGENGRHFADDIFRCVFVNQKNVSRLKFHRNLYVRVQLIITHHWFI